MPAIIRKTQDKIVSSNNNNNNITNSPKSLSLNLLEDRQFMSAIDSANAETLMHRLEYVALPFEAVSENVKNRAILGDFKQKFGKC